MVKKVPGKGNGVKPFTKKGGNSRNSWEFPGISLDFLLKARNFFFAISQDFPSKEFPGTYTTQELTHTMRLDSTSNFMPYGKSSKCFYR
jgi:hypothetical protein